MPDAMVAVRALVVSTMLEWPTAAPSAATFTALSMFGTLVPGSVTAVAMIHLFQGAETIAQLYDRTVRGTDADTQDIQQGPAWSDWTIATQAYPDWAGWLFRAMIGPD